MIKFSNKKKYYFFFFLFNFLISHFYPLVLILINMLSLIVCHFRKEYQIRNYIGLYLFIVWPCCFYIYLHCFVNAVVNNHALLLQTYESPYYVKMNLESFLFWVLRFGAVDVIKFPILGVELNSVYFKQFLFETFYGLALICEILGLSFSLKIF